MRQLAIATALLMVAALATPALAQDLPDAVRTDQQMVVTAHPLATQAGEDVLHAGGTAADAMVAVQTVLGLVEPQSTGIAGGAFVVYHDAATGATTTYDAREVTPMASGEDRFEGMDFFPAWQSGLSVGVPGNVRMMEDVHADHGRLPWAGLFSRAEELASDGYALTQRTSDTVNQLLGFNDDCTDRLFFRDPVAFEYFTNGDEVDCEAKPAGTTITNAAYADTMSLLANEGADAFYTGDMAQAIVDAVATDPNIPGDMTLADLAAYEVIPRDPVCVDYRGHEVCGMGPPSSGAIAVGQMLGILEHFDLGDDPLDEETVHRYTQAGRLAFADRNLYVGDTDFVTVPVEGMLDEDYLAQRAALITDTDMGQAAPGTPPGEFDPSAPQQTDTEGGTSHVSIVDRHGNALSMTTTIESPFGNGVMVAEGGFLLNNELTDFSFAATDDDGAPIANRVQPGKRPRSSMAPTIVFGADGDLELVTGSPGGSRIISYTAKSIINVIDFGLDPQQAINVPHYLNNNGDTELEMPVPGVTLDYDVEALQQALEARDHTVVVREETSGLSMIQVTEDGLVGGADARRDGTVGGAEPALGETGLIRLDGDATGHPIDIATEICRSLVADGEADRIALARVDDFADAMAGSALPVDCILFTGGGPDAELHATTAAEIDRALGEDGRVFVLGGEEAVSAAAADAVDADVTRLAGGTRYETAEAVATEVIDTTGATEVLLAYGEDWADAVTAGAYAHATGAPVVLTETDTLHPAAQRIIDRVGQSGTDARTVVIGGEAVIGPDVMAALPGAVRVAGGNRMATATAIAEVLWPDAGATGQDFVLGNLEHADAWTVALAAAPLADAIGGPILGLRTDALPSETAAYLTGLQLATYPSVVFLGDEALISTAVANAVGDLVTPG